MARIPEGAAENRVPKEQIELQAATTDECLPSSQEFLSVSWEVCPRV